MNPLLLPLLVSLALANHDVTLSKYFAHTLCQQDDFCILQYQHSDEIFNMTCGEDCDNKCMVNRLDLSTCSSCKAATYDPSYYHFQHISNG